MTVPSFGEAAARGQKKPAKTTSNQRYGALAGAGALGVGAGSITAGYAHGRINQAHAADENALADLKSARSAANKKRLAVQRQLDAAGRKRIDAVNRYDDFTRWSRGNTGDVYWQSNMPAKLKISRTNPNHRKFIQDEHDLLAAAGREAEHGHHKLLNMHDDAEDAAIAARKAVKGFKPSANVGRYASLALRGKVGAALGAGAVGAGIYGIERSRQHTPRMSVQPKYASQASVGRKNDIDLGKMRAAAYRAGKPAGGMSDDELHSWFASNHGGH